MERPNDELQDCVCDPHRRDSRKAVGCAHKSEDASGKLGQHSIRVDARLTSARDRRLWEVLWQGEVSFWVSDDEHER
jgi:hypothetical protein